MYTVGGNTLSASAQRWKLRIWALTVPLLGPQLAAAADVLGLYAGGAGGESQVHINAQGFAAENFSANHSAFQLMAGVRPVSFLGTELEYVDFGHPSSSLNGGAANATLKGAGVFGMVFLPVPSIDFYAKAGLARLRSTLNGYSEYQPLQTACIPCSPSHFELDRTDTGFAAGAGARYKFRALAVRLEYEYFSITSAHPNLVSVGLTWTFF